MRPTASQFNKITQVNITMSPAPTDEEAAAIVVATEVLWPKAATLGPVSESRNTSWRFSSRSWAQPTPIRRLRPWR
jgi:hypothetical protein|tara:strand:+ start:724 stop:951 length:228 start_codon:yes stop_codon:yes gene_type:complete